MKFNISARLNLYRLTEWKCFGILQLIQEFEFRAVGEPVPPVMTMVLKPGKPLRIKFNDRK